MDVEGLLQSVIRFSNFMTSRLVVSGVVFYVLSGFTDIGSTTEGFLPEEREWFGAQLGPRRLIDVQRKLVGEVSGPMSWWSWMGQAFEKDVGWRIDYHLATPDLAKSAVQAVTDRAASREERISDHTAVVIDYNM